jgi:hypothetical protein
VVADFCDTVVVVETVYRRRFSGKNASKRPQILGFSAEFQIGNRHAARASCDENSCNAPARFSYKQAQKKHES